MKSELSKKSPNSTQKFSCVIFWVNRAAVRSSFPRLADIDILIARKAINIARIVLKLFFTVYRVRKTVFDISSVVLFKTLQMKSEEKTVTQNPRNGTEAPKFDLDSIKIDPTDKMLKETKTTSTVSKLKLLELWIIFSKICFCNEFIFLTFSTNSESS